MPQKENTKIKSNFIEIIIFIFLWLLISFLVFYKGSMNVGIWGKWEDFEIVLPLMVSFFLSSVLVFPLYKAWRFLKNRKK